jgi:hypothetical protein
MELEEREERLAHSDGRGRFARAPQRGFTRPRISVQEFANCQNLDSSIRSNRPVINDLRVDPEMQFILPEQTPITGSETSRGTRQLLGLPLRGEHIGLEACDPLL